MSIVESLWQRVLSLMHEGVMITDRHANILFVNQAVTRLTGYEDYELIGNNPRLLSSGQQNRHFYMKMWDALRERGYWQGIVVNRKKDGSDYTELLSITSVAASSGETTHYIGVFYDVSDRVRMEESLKRMAYQDPLTNLPNRRYFERLLPEWVEDAKRSHRSLALCVFDLDDFSKINEQYGKDQGDLILQHVARSLQTLIIKDEALIHLGGDEFAVLIHTNSLSPEQFYVNRIQAMQKEIAKPIKFNDDEIELETSVGAALYPQHGTDGSQLLRIADRAMQQVKSRKLQRSTGWQIGLRGEEAEDTLVMPTPYGTVEQELLRKMQGLIEVNIPGCVDASVRWLREYIEKTETSDIGFTENIWTLFVKEHTDLLQFLFSPSTTRNAIAENAKNLGERHALLGIHFQHILSVVAHHVRYWSEALRMGTGSARNRYWLTRVMENRLHDHMIFQMEAMNETVDRYMWISNVERVPEGTWVDIKKTELDAIGALPGVFGVMLLRSDVDGGLPIEMTAGVGASAILTMMGGLSMEEADIAVAAIKLHQIVSVSDILHHPVFLRLRQLAEGQSVRSSMAIPVFNHKTEQVMVLVLFGRFENQFESAWMKTFAQSQQRRWLHLWYQYGRFTDTVVISQEQAVYYRDRLFAGGLVMYYQPIVALDTGRLSKVEALARLRLDDGTMIPPNVFLPLLENDEMDRLFQLGLEQAVAIMVAWERRGLSIGVSINLAPLTLLNPSCVIWVKDVVQRYQISPELLTFELLETQDIDQTAQGEAIQRLKNLGVKLAVDDLGSGYSSLLRLSRLPFDVVKIEQGLLANLSKEPIPILNLIHGLIQIGRGLGKEVVVEGVENVGIIEAMMIFKATMGQGYGIARPMPAEKVLVWSQQFQSSIVPGEIHTYVGALAYHWRFFQHKYFVPKISEDTCPLSLFFEEKGLQGEEVAMWHKKIHENVDLKHHSNLVLKWLEERAREELLNEC